MPGMFPGETIYIDLKEFVAGLPERSAADEPGWNRATLIIGLSIIVVVIPILMLAMILLKRWIES